MNALISRIKALYKRMTLREKLLTLTFILVILLLWTNNWFGRLSEWNDQRNYYANELLFQQKTLERGPQISEGLERALARVDPEKTFAASQLAGRIDRLLRSAGLSTQADIDTVRTREGEIFNDHNLRVRLDSISIEQLINFNALLKEDNPYINVQSVRVSANRNRPEELDVRFEINSFDLKDQIL